MRSIRLALLILLALPIAMPALAQFGGSHRGGSSGRGDRSSQQDGDSQRSEVTRMSANDQIRMQITNVHLALKLSPEQDAAWQGYENKTVELLSDLSRGGAPSPPGESAPKQIERKVDVVRNRLAAMEDLSDAARKLYASLTDEQKGVADRMLPGTVPALYSGASTGAQSDGRSQRR